MSSSGDVPARNPNRSRKWVLDDIITVWINSEVTVPPMLSVAAAAATIRKMWIKFRVDWMYEDDMKKSIFEYSYAIDYTTPGDHVTNIFDHIIPRAVRSAAEFSVDPQEILTGTIRHHMEELSSSIRRLIEDVITSNRPPVDLKLIIGTTIYPDMIGECVPFYVMKNIELNVYKEVEQEFSLQAGECSICLNKIEEDEVVGKLPCRHVFHDDCVLRSLKRSYLCPYCRREVGA